MKKPWIKERFLRNCAQRKLRDFESLRRRCERELFFWVGFRRGRASITECIGDELESLERCETGGDFLRFYLETAEWHLWKQMPLRDRWHHLRRSASPYYSDGTAKQPYDRNTELEKLRDLMEIDPGVLTGVLP